MSIREFFGFGGYEREAEGYFSWQHLVFVSTLVVIMIICAIILGRKNKDKSIQGKNKVLVVAAILIDAFEIFKIVLISIRGNDPKHILYDLPLFLCSIQLITIPLAAFSKGRLKNAALDFVTIFGMLGAIIGTYFAGNNYGTYPVICFDNVVSGITHCLSGFASLYIMISGMTSMRKRNVPITIAILAAFCIAAFIANKILDYNYMFLVRGDGTPYDIIYNLVNGHPVFYPMMVIVLFLIYIAGFYTVFYFKKKYEEKRR